MKETIMIRNGKTAKLIMARKEHTCAECHLPIHSGDHYWEVTLNGAGLGSIKFPDRTHIGTCLEKNLSGGKRCQMSKRKSEPS